MSSPTEIGTQWEPRWGVLPAALVVATLVGARLGALALPKSSRSVRALFGAASGIATVVAVVRILGTLGALTQIAIFFAIFAVAIVAIVADPKKRVGISLRGVVTVETAPIAIVAGGAVLSAIVAGYFFPIWQWDALGYHLPYVNFALQAGGFRGIPPDMPYVATYPHVVEDIFLAWRAMLPDDRLVDLAQIPFGLLGALAIAVFARQLGARRDHAAAAGFLWLTVPALFLQLPTNYVDVGAAALLLAAATLTLLEPTLHHVLAAGVAIGLLLGSKPNAPIASTLLFGVVAVRGWKAGRRGSLVAAAGLAGLFGLESYVTNIVRHGNPSWPVKLSLGPIVLPGDLSMETLLASGCAAPRVEGSLPLRLLRSWTALDAPPVFDMRYGGFGIAFLVALPFAFYFVARRKSLPLVVVMLAALASPDPAVARYVFAFPGIVFAIGAASITERPRWTRQVVFAALALVSLVFLVRVFPGLAGEGPTLAEYPSMSEPARLRAVGADGTPERFFDALDRVPHGKTTGFDSSLELPYLAWPPTLATHAMRVSDTMSDAEAARFVGDPELGLLIVGERSPLANAALAAGFSQLSRCRSRLPPACVAAAAAEGERSLEILNRKWPSCVVLLRE